MSPRVRTSRCGSSTSSRPNTSRCGPVPTRRPPSTIITLSSPSRQRPGAKTSARIGTQPCGVDSRKRQPPASPSQASGRAPSWASSWASSNSRAMRWPSSSTRPRSLGEALTATREMTMPAITMTTSNSSSVKPAGRRRCGQGRRGSKAGVAGTMWMKEREAGGLIPSCRYRRRWRCRRPGRRRRS
ncbi:hypothetical protein D3C87_1175560 [compost metagenome]